MVGYPGAGKTTTAKLIHDITGAVHLWADHERSRRFQKPTHSHKENLELYAQLNEETRQLLSEGKSVIFDTNFNFYKDREHLRQIADAEGARTVVVWITTDKTLARDRAVAHPSPNETRIWGNMPSEAFERITGNLQEPRAGEHPLMLNGKDMTRDVVERALATLAA
jgi:predicted kinase